MVAKLNALYAWFLTIANSLQSPTLLLIRLYWGWQFFETGKGKLADIPKVVDYFTSIGVPAPALNAHFIALLEAGGGILLVLGLASRLIAVPLLIDMVMAYVIADREALGSIFSEPEKFYNAAPFTFLLASLLILVFGPGKFSLDTLIAARWKKKTQAAVASSR
jgi:putative oxidoreductase